MIYGIKRLSQVQKEANTIDFLVKGSLYIGEKSYYCMSSTSATTETKLTWGKNRVGSNETFHSVLSKFFKDFGDSWEYRNKSVVVHVITRIRLMNRCDPCLF